MDLTFYIDWLGDRGVEFAGGLAVGLAFGFFAQRSQFCLRAATVEFWRGSPGAKLAIWLLVFFTALAGTQALLFSGLLDKASVRQLSATGSLSGAIVGGLMFGVGMVLARGCASRLLVLSATGNMRAFMSGLLLTIVAQASLGGVLSPLRMEIAGWGPISGGARDLLGGSPQWLGIVIGVFGLAGAAAWAARCEIGRWAWAGGIGVGLAIVGGWAFTAGLAAQSFELIAVKSVSFTGPSADTLMSLVDRPQPDLGFDLGLVPGVFAGSMIGAFLGGDIRIQGFNESTGMLRYIIGAVLMGFGSMLAAGCAVGAGVTGGSVMALTAWLALLCMWIGAGLADFVVDRGGGRLLSERRAVKA